MTMLDELVDVFHRHEDRIRALTDSIPAFVALVDESHRYRFNNEAYSRLYGRSHLELEGKHVSAILGEAYATVGPRLDIALAGHSSHVTTVLPRSDNGTWTARATYVPLGDGNGAVGGVLVFVVDETARREAEEALRRSEAGYRALVENAPVGIFRLASDGRLLAANPAFTEILGYGAVDELPVTALGESGLALSRRFIDPDGGVVAETISGVELDWRRADGTPIRVAVSGRLLSNGPDTSERIEGIVEDVTEKRRFEALVRQAQRMDAIGQLTGGIAHDFNNILTVVLGNVELLRESLPQVAEGELLSGLKDIEAAARRGTKLIRKLLGFSRRAALELEPADLSALAHEASRVLRRLLPETIRVELDAPSPAPVHADLQSVEQMILNLATNARDAMPDGGVLSLSVRADLDRRCDGVPLESPLSYSLAVSDDGRGMDEATIARIFEPFFTTKPAGSGTGLGMAMVYGLMKQHRGHVTVSSTPGLGTTVELRFPALTEGPGDPGRDADPAPVPTPKSEPVAAVAEDVILVVEDDEDVRAVAEATLSRAGYRVVAVADGREAVETLRRRPSEVDLVLSDIVMPRLCGRELYEELRAVDPSVPVLFMSGYSRRSAAACTDLPSDVPQISKPWRSTELVRRVRELVNAGAPEGIREAGASESRSDDLPSASPSRTVSEPNAGKE